MLTLDATLLSDLEWESSSGEIFLDFGLFDRLLKPIEDEAQFRSFELAIRHFLSTVWNEKVSSVYLYQGPADIPLSHAHYLCQLAELFPEEVALKVALDVSGITSPLQRAFATRRDLYSRFSFEKETAPLALLLPALRGEYPLLDAHLQTLRAPYRVIPEEFLALEWEGLDTLMISEQSAANRFVLGFKAAGGTILTY